jgi:hypothetical protein
VKYCLITLRWDFNEHSIVWSNGHHWPEVVRPVDVDFFISFSLYFFLFIFGILLRILNHKKISSTPPGQFFIILIFRYDSTRFIINIKMWGNDITRTCFYTANTQIWPRLLICRNRWFSDINFVIIRLILLFGGRKFADLLFIVFFFWNQVFILTLSFPLNVLLETHIETWAYIRTFSTYYTHKWKFITICAITSVQFDEGTPLLPNFG